MSESSVHSRPRRAVISHVQHTRSAPRSEEALCLARTPQYLASTRLKTGQTQPLTHLERRGFAAPIFRCFSPELGSKEFGHEKGTKSAEGAVAGGEPARSSGARWGGWPASACWRSPASGPSSPQGPLWRPSRHGCRRSDRRQDRSAHRIGDSGVTGKTVQGADEEGRDSAVGARG